MGTPSRSGSGGGGEDDFKGGELGATLLSGWSTDLGGVGLCMTYQASRHMMSTGGPRGRYGMKPCIPFRESTLRGFYDMALNVGHATLLCLETMTVPNSRKYCSWWRLERALNLWSRGLAHVLVD